MDQVASCLTQTETIDGAFDCLAQGILVRESWIAAAIAACGAAE